jgi:hypothetical protein
MEFKFAPTFYNFQEKQGSKVAISSEKDKMFPIVHDSCTLHGGAADEPLWTSNPTG